MQCLQFDLQQYTFIYSDRRLYLKQKFGTKISDFLQLAQKNLNGSMNRNAQCPVFNPCDLSHIKINVRVPANFSEKTVTSSNLNN